MEKHFNDDHIEMTGKEFFKEMLGVAKKFSKENAEKNGDAYVNGDEIVLGILNATGNLLKLMGNGGRISDGQSIIEDFQRTFIAYISENSTKMKVIDEQDEGSAMPEPIKIILQMIRRSEESEGQADGGNDGSSAKG